MRSDPGSSRLPAARGGAGGRGRRARHRDRSASHQSIGQLAPGTLVIALDAPAPFAGHRPKRDDLACFVTHPCHPPIFNEETDPAAGPWRSIPRP